MVANEDYVFEIKKRYIKNRGILIKMFLSSLKNNTIVTFKF